MEGGDKIAPLECVKKYEDVGHEIIVRELTQNALDAAREARRPCNVNVRIETVPTEELPGIEDYREHLSAECMQAWEEKGQHKYVEAIDNLRRLSRAPQNECLMFFDNGVGLNVDTMEGLIGKGDTMKEEGDGGSGGNHGVGHETAFAAGDMNFVMYGGVNRQAQRVASGHAVLPTHILGRQRFGGHGYLAADVAQLSLSGVEIVKDADRIPPLIQRQLDHIADGGDNGRSAGSVVIIPAFNRFPDTDGNATADCCAQICEDIAKHFFVAVAQQRLSVTVTDCALPREGGGGGGGGQIPPVCKMKRM